MNSLLYWTCLLCTAISLTDSRSLTGQGETRQRRMDPRKAELFKAFEEKFLKMLGLKGRPVVTKHTRVPQYMMELYENQVKDEEYVTTNLKFKNFATTANTVRGFYHSDVNMGGEMSRRRKRRFVMDLSSVPSHEELVRADFRFYRGNVTATGSPKSVGKHTINVYQLLRSGIARDSVNRQLLQSRSIDEASMDEGWESFDILEAVRSWSSNPRANHGLEIDVINENGNPMDTSHLRFDKPHELDLGTWTHHRPLLTLFTRDPKNHHHVRREKRSANKGYDKNLCGKHDLSVNFTQLGWDWVEGPKVYNAYTCRGDCVYPMVNHMNATNHAIVQSIVHSVKNYHKNVPSACCIPISYDSFGLLYIDNNLPIFKQYTNMVVTACGCR